MPCHPDTKQTIDYLLWVQIIISLAVAFIALAQYKTNNNKLRLDLYNRRFAVYDKTLAYYQVCYSRDSNNEALREIATDFVRAYRESFFLFGRESAVYKALTEIKDTFGFLGQFDAKFKSEPNNKDELRAWSEIKASKPDPTKLMESLEQALTPWLDFQKIGK